MNKRKLIDWFYRSHMYKLVLWSCLYVIEIEIQVPLAQSIASSPVSIGSVAVLAFVVVIAIILWVALKKKKIPEDIPNASKKLYNVIIIIKFI